MTVPASLLEKNSLPSAGKKIGKVTVSMAALTSFLSAVNLIFLKKRKLGTFLEFRGIETNMGDLQRLALHNG